MGYWGRRYFSARLGRWLSRDPIEDRLSRSLLEYARSSPTMIVDILGEAIWSGPPLYPPTPASFDLVQIHCGMQMLPAVGVIGLNHCRLVCSPGSLSEPTFIADGTGPTTSPNDNGSPGYVDEEWPTAAFPTSPFAGSVKAPLGTCACIRKKGDALNNVRNKAYHLWKSNSNSALSLVIRCCGVSITPTRSAPGWGKPVKRGCETRTQYRGNTWSTIVSKYCPIGCNDLK